MLEEDQHITIVLPLMIIHQQVHMMEILQVRPMLSFSITKQSRQQILQDQQHKLPMV